MGRQVPSGARYLSLTVWFNPPSEWQAFALLSVFPLLLASMPPPFLKTILYCIYGLLSIALASLDYRSLLTTIPKYLFFHSWAVYDSKVLVHALTIRNDPIGEPTPAEKVKVRPHWPDGLMVD